MFSNIAYFKETNFNSFKQSYGFLSLDLLNEDSLGVDKANAYFVLTNTEFQKRAYLKSFEYATSLAGLVDIMVKILSFYYNLIKAKKRLLLI